MVLVFFVQHVWVQYSEKRNNFNHWYVELVSTPYIFINYFLRVRILPYIILKRCLNVHYFFVNIFLDYAWFLHGLLVKWEKTVQRHSFKLDFRVLLTDVGLMWIIRVLYCTWCSCTHWPLLCCIVTCIQFSFVYKCFCVQATAQFPTNMRRCFSFV